MTAERFPTQTDEERQLATDEAAKAIRRGRLVVLPTDTVYGLGADAFDPDAVARLLAAKGRGREMPPPILVSTPGTLDALAVRIPDYVAPLVARFWPGGLTLVCHQQPSLQWDLGDTRGTVAVRMPDDEVARALLDRTGPLAVSSANLTGRPAAMDADEAIEMLGESVAVVVDGGPVAGGVASTIIDATSDRPRLLRAGAISVEQLDEVLAELDLSVEVEPRPVEAARTEGDTEEAGPTDA